MGLHRIGLRQDAVSEPPSGEHSFKPGLQVEAYA
jgi:hypothetical protein